MVETTGLKFGALPAEAAHLCVDMQVMFAEGTPWATPWMRRVLPNVVRICEHAGPRTVFTRFIPAAEPDAAEGTWRRYYERWNCMTRARLGVEPVGLLHELRLFAPSGFVIDKTTFSPWLNGRLRTLLVGMEVDTVIVSGGETDVCVLATVMGAIDLGFRVVVAADALCSGVDETHDDTLSLFHDRFGEQVETAIVDEILDAWPARQAS